MQGILPVIIVVLVIGIAMALAAYFILRRNRPDLVEQRLAEYIEKPVSLEKLELEQPFRDRVIRPIIAFFARIVSSFTPNATQDRLRQNLAIAGNPNNMTPADFLGIRLLSAFLVGGLIGILLFLANTPLTWRILGPVIFFVLGFMLPVYWLGGKMKKRRRAILRALPDAIDLLTICVEAGLGFDQALLRVTEKWDNELGKEFKRMLAEQRVGKTRRDALKELAIRCDVQELSVFVASIVQADQLGVSMTKVLRIQADQMRIRRRQLAEELAHKAPIKMLFPMAFLILPTIYIVILGPVIPTVAKAMGFNVE
jgi:tight adherence protein C